MTKNIFSLIVNECAFELFISINSGEGRKSIHKLCRFVGCSYPYCFKMIDKFSELGLIKSDKSGRVRVSYYTKKGREIKKLMLHIENQLKGC